MSLAALDPSHFARRLARPRPVLAIASGKGGVGKTWFAVTLAHAFALAGQRTLLFDGDLGLANIDVQLGLTPKLDLAAVVAERTAMADAVTCFPAGGFDVIAGRSGSANLATLPAGAVDRLGRQLARTAGGYDSVIVDLGAGVEKTVWRLAGAATTCLVVCTDEPTSLIDAYAFIKLALRADPGRDLRVVVNQAASQGEGERTYRTLTRACESFLNWTPRMAGIVRRDERVREAVRAQAPSLLRHPDGPASKDVRAIADALVKCFGPELS